jgi:hypothetical protein
MRGDQVLKCSLTALFHRPLLKGGVNMVKFLQALAVTVVFSFCMVPLGHGTELGQTDSSQTATSERTIIGDVQMIEGEFYFVKDTTGHQVRLHVNQESKLMDRIKVGDKIEAKVTPDGHVMAMAVEVPQNGTVPLLPNMAPIPPR